MSDTPTNADNALPQDPVTPNPWAGLRAFTAARIALGRAGVSLPTQAHLAFQLAHAQARDAVHVGLDVPTLAHELAVAWPELPAPLCLHSAAAHRAQYLQRPDLGRRLNAASVQTLQALNPPAPPGQVYADDADHRPFDLALVVADGLSARAMAQNAVPFVQALRQRLLAEAWTLAPITLVSQGRVAVGDDVGQRLGARAVVVLIGERPGLSSPDSMGLYLTWMPRIGLTDASRNCISNVRPAGLGHDLAAAKLHHLLSQARLRRLSGVELKDDTEAQPLAQGADHDGTGSGFFLTR